MDYDRLLGLMIGTASVTAANQPAVLAARSAPGKAGRIEHRAAPHPSAAKLAVGDPGAQRSDRNVGPLRYHHDPGVFGKLDLALGERPDPRDRAQKGRFPRSRRSGNEHALAGRKCKPPRVDDLASVRQRDAEARQRNARCAIRNKRQTAGAEGLCVLD